MAAHTVTVEHTLSKLLQEKRYAAIRDVLATMNPADIAAVFNEVQSEQRPLLFRLLPKELAAETFVEMDPDTQEQLIHGFSDSELHEVVDELYVDDAVDIVEEMPANVVKRILAQVSPDMRKEINEILQYPENSTGSIMTTEYISLRPDMCLDKSTKIEDLMNPNVITVTTLTDQEETARKLSKYNFLAMPVVDSDGRMVGIVTFDDAMDVLQEEVTEDIEIMGGMTPSDKTYMRSSPVDLFRHRIPWLLLLMVSATFTGMIITNFENALAAQVVLTAFIPMLMDTGGNSGSQSSVTVIRAISLGEVDFRDLAAVVWKEIRSSVMCGIALACACFGKIMLIDRLILHNTDVTVTVALVVCCTMVLTVMVAEMIGCTLPIIAKKLGFDPAVMASPFITTIVDAVSLLLYFGIATLLLFR